jgi:hypothetical protein
VTCLAIAAGAVVAASALLLAALCLAAGRGDRDDPPDTDRDAAAGLFHIPPPEED